MSGFAKIDLSGEAHALAAGRYDATISEARVIKSRDEQALWLMVTLDTHNEDGELLGQVEDNFITIGARGGSPAEARLREGLKRLATYGIACAVDFNGKEPNDIPSLLIGQRVKAVVSRRGNGVQAENRVVTVLPVGA